MRRVSEPRTRRGIAYDELSEYLRVLGVANRLELLRKLQWPRAVSEIQLTPARRAKDRAPDRALSRNAVELHLKRLQELGLVHARTRATAEGRDVTEYVVNHARMFVVTDELRRVSLQRTSPVERTDAAEDDPSVEPPQVPKGASLLLVNGPLEGSAFSLKGDGPWVVGRETGVDVALPYDAFVSRDNTRIVREGARFVVEAVAGARNGTRVNWQLLAPGERRALCAGDVVGVGRSLLVLRVEGDAG